MTRRCAWTTIGAIGLIAASLVGLSPSTVAAQTPPRDVRPQPASAPAGTAKISGAVVSAESGAKPVRLAYVVIIGATTGVLRVTSTDNDGRFAFANLPADRYVVGASKLPYLGSVAGAKRPARPGTPIAVKDGESIADVTIRMPLGAAISGVIMDERGQPATNVVVTLQQRRLQGGERVFVLLGGTSASTDDRGRYRLHSLPPGEYVVLARPFGSGSSMAMRALSDADVDAALKGTRVPPAPAPPPGATPAPVYFPGTTSLSDAVPIALAAGEERQSVDFRLELARTALIEGTVLTSDGQPLSSVGLQYGQLVSTSLSAMMLSSRMMPLMPDGRFSIAGLAPGVYSLVAREVGPQGRFAGATIEVAGVDQTGVQLTLRPPLAFPARIAFEGTAPPPALAGRQVPLRVLPPGIVGFARPQVTATTATGAFTVTGVLPGQYVLGGPLSFGPTSDSMTWALQSVVVDGRDVTDLPLAITADAVPKDVVVTFGDRWQELTGRLRQSSGAAATDYTIVVFPADKKYWLPGSRRILTARPGTDGLFRLGGPGPITLAPGAYLLAAVTDIERDEQFDPAFLESLVASAASVTLQPGERKVQDVVIK